MVPNNLQANAAAFPVSEALISPKSQPRSSRGINRRPSVFELRQIVAKPEVGRAIRFWTKYGVSFPLEGVHRSWCWQGEANATYRSQPSRSSRSPIRE